MPSPAMVVAIVALIVAMSGTAIAAVDFARNAGAVDGRSAVTARASLKQAAGKLVATSNGGPSKGRIPGRFVQDVMRGGSASLSRYLRAVDNSDGPVVPLAIIPRIGRLDAQCRDQDPTPEIKSTQTLVTFTAADERGVNVSRLLGSDLSGGREGVVFTALKDQPVAVMNFADSFFQLTLQARNRTVFISGAARPDLNRTAAAACLIFGVGLRVG
ncbi:MAG TPA: hypothetical protein VMY78_08225 [Solirubrobacteraceae bacterium]|nr:hypothetical protein [Solirubrobacteraceae bacterium]